jgi:hypothetical protein
VCVLVCRCQKWDARLDRETERFAYWGLREQIFTGRVHEVRSVVTKENLGRVTIAPATPEDRTSIYRLRHDVYADELGQHIAEPSAMLSDALDESNTYITAKIRGQLAGFISITPPSLGRYSIEKYLGRDELPIRLTCSPAQSRGLVPDVRCLSLGGREQW